MFSSQLNPGPSSHLFLFKGHCLVLEYSIQIGNFQGRPAIFQTWNPWKLHGQFYCRYLWNMTLGKMITHYTSFRTTLAVFKFRYDSFLYCQLTALKSYFPILNVQKLHELFEHHNSMKYILCFFCLISIKKMLSFLFSLRSKSSANERKTHTYHYTVIRIVLRLVDNFLNYVFISPLLCKFLILSITLLFKVVLWPWHPTLHSILHIGRVTVSIAPSVENTPVDWD